MKQPNESLAALLLRPAEAAKLLGCSPAFVYRMAASGELPSIRLGAAVRIPARALAEWIERNTQNAKAA